MIRHKSEYIKAMGLGGGMIWALDLDDFRNNCDCEKYPLLRTINRVLRNYTIPAPNCILGSPEKKPSKKPSTLKPKPKPTSTTHAPWSKPEAESVVTVPPPDIKPCDGKLFTQHNKNCNQYYLCNQGQLILQSCPTGLFWNKDHCDWPENTECHPDATTLSPTSTTNYEQFTEPTYEITTEEAEESPSTESSSKPAHPSTDFIPTSDYKIVCYFTNWAWYRYHNKIIF